MQPSNARQPPAVGPSGPTALDPINFALLRELTKDPRATTAELARQVGLSAPAVSARVARMEETGVIRGYRLDIDPAALGLPVTAWVRVRPEPRQLPKIAALAADTPQVVECHRVSGDDCFLMRIHVSDVGSLTEVLDRFLLYGQTTSMFVVGTPVPPRSIIPAAFPPRP